VCYWEPQGVLLELERSERLGPVCYSEPQGREPEWQAFLEQEYWELREPEPLALVWPEQEC